MKENNFNIDDLIIRYLSGEATSKENNVISNWVHQSPENKSHFMVVRNIWLATSQIDITINGSNSSQLSFNSYSINGINVQKAQTKSINPVLVRISKIAAILIIGLLIGTLTNTQFANKQINTYQNDVVVEAVLGSKAITTLPDGTRVWLNGGSKLTYNKNYNSKSREVTLVGEGYFNVITNPSKPFIVKADKIAIKALGTSFNVKAYPDDKSVVTALVKGKVVIEGKDILNHSFTVQMKPNEIVTYNKKIAANNVAHSTKVLSTKEKSSGLAANKLTPNFSVIKQEKVKIELFTSWKDESWVIEKQNLETLATEFERRFNIKIQIASPIIKKFHFTGTIQKETIEQIMLIMCHTIPMKYRIDKGIIIIDEDKLLMKEFNLKN